MEEDGSILFTSHHQEKELRPGDGHEEFIPAFNAYTPPGTVEGDLIYVHYARVEDLRQLKEMGMNVTGKICMARYFFFKSTLKSLKLVRTLVSICTFLDMAKSFEATK